MEPNSNTHIPAPSSAAEASFKSAALKNPGDGSPRPSEEPAVTSINEPDHADPGGHGAEPNRSEEAGASAKELNCKVKEEKNEVSAQDEPDGNKDDASGKRTLEDVTEEGGNEPVKKKRKPAAKKPTISGRTTFNWTLVDRPAGSKLSKTSVEKHRMAEASFVPDVPGKYTLQLASKGHGTTYQETATFLVKDVKDKPIGRTVESTSAVEEVVPDESELNTYSVYKDFSKMNEDAAAPVVESSPSKIIQEQAVLPATEGKEENLENANIIEKMDVVGEHPEI